jgi:hypothetical protein
MNRKIIIKSGDFDREILFFLREIGAGIPIDWDNETLDRVRNAAIEAFERMGVGLEIDDQVQSPYYGRGLEAESITRKILMRLK